MNRPQLLSICIPTFNRLNYLEESLKTLIPQALLHDVEICISSNNSTDGTNKFLKELSRKYSFIKCNFHIQGVGIDENMLFVLSMASGKYIYPLGDDDVIPVGCLEHILKEISRGGDLIVMNGWHTDATLTKLRVHLSSSLAGVCFTRPDLAFLKLWDKLPFGSFIATRDCFHEVDSRHYLGTSHAYVGIVWDALANKFNNNQICQIRCVYEPAVLLRGADKTWKKNEAEILFIQIPTWFKLIGCNFIYKKILRLIRKEYMANITSTYFLLNLRANGQINIKNCIYYSRYCNIVKKLKICVISIFPSALSLLVVKTLRVIFLSLQFFKRSMR